MVYTVEIEKGHIFLRQAGRDLGVIKLDQIDLKDKKFFETIDKIKFSRIQQENYDFSKRPRAYTKKEFKNRVYFFFEKDNCEIYFNAEDGKVYDMFDKEIPAGKISGNFKNAKTEDDNSKNFIDYLYKDITHYSSTPSMKTVLQKLYKQDLECIRKMFMFGVYLSKSDLLRVEIEDVTKDVVNILKEKSKVESIPSRVLATVHLSKRHHETFVKYLNENNLIYFDILYSYYAKYKELIEFFRYDEVSLIDYITRIKETQNLELNKIMEYIYDYANMHHVMGIEKFDKYPRYLSSMHDMTIVKLNNYKKNNKIELSKVYKLGYTSWEDEKISSSYKIEVPSNTNDIIEEGKELSHCVASYIDRILKGETSIVFMRRKGYWSSSDIRVLTLEIRENALVQARGKCNRNPEKGEYEFLKAFCKVKGYEYKI